MRSKRVEITRNCRSCTSAVRVRTSRKYMLERDVFRLQGGCSSHCSTRASCLFTFCLLLQCLLVLSLTGSDCGNTERLRKKNEKKTPPKPITKRKVPHLRQLCTCFCLTSFCCAFKCVVQRYAVCLQYLHAIVFMFYQVTSFPWYLTLPRNQRGKSPACHELASSVQLHLPCSPAVR